MNEWHIDRKSPDFINPGSQSAYKAGNKFQAQRPSETQKEGFGNIL